MILDLGQCAYRGESTEYDFATNLEVTLGECLRLVPTLAVVS